MENFYKYENYIYQTSFRIFIYFEYSKEAILYLNNVCIVAWIILNLKSN